MRTFVLLALSACFTLAPSLSSALLQTTESTPLRVSILGSTACIDGIDNDSDGKIDFPNDPGCVDYDDLSELDVITNGGGGGGSPAGAGSVVFPRTLTFTGVTFARGIVTIVKNGVVVGTSVAGEDGRFEIHLQPSSGFTVFGAFVASSSGDRSPSIPLSVIDTGIGSLVVSGIKFAPITTSHFTSIPKGSSLPVEVYSTPHQVVFLNTDPLFQTLNMVTNEKGFASTTLNTTGLIARAYRITPSTIDDNQIRISGTPFSFVVGTAFERTQEKKSCDVLGTGDMNCDARVNLVDFSIAAFWYKKPNPPAKVDMNKDGKVTLVDLSILAYYWTG